MTLRNTLKKGLFFIFLILFTPILFLESRAFASLTLTPSLSISEQYNDNFLFLGDHREEDLNTTIGSGLILTYSNPYFIMGAHYRAGAAVSRKIAEGNRYTQYLNFNIALPFLSRKYRGVDIRITETSDFTPEIPAKPLGGPAERAFTTTLGRIDTFRNTASIGLSYSGIPRWVTDFNYRNLIVQYEGNPLITRLEDSMSHHIDMSEAYTLSSRTRFNILYGIVVNEFEFRDGFTEQRMTVGGEHRFNSRLFMSGSIGGSFLTGNTTALVSEIGLTNKIEKADLKLGYVRRVTTGEGVITTATLGQTVSAETSYPVTAQTSLAFTVDYTHTNTLLDAIATKTVSNGVTGVLTTRFLPWLSGSASYAYFNLKETGLRTLDATRNTITFSLTASNPGLRLIQ